MKLWDDASRIAYFEAHADSYDVLFLGSGHFYRGVVPEVFDAEVAATPPYFFPARVAPSRSTSCLSSSRAVAWKCG